MAQAEALGMSDSGYSKSIRITDRVVAFSEALGRALFERIRAQLGEGITIEERKITHPLHCPPASVVPSQRGIAASDYQAGAWQPHDLNECFRICRYRPGGFFAPHHDGGFNRNSKQRSLKTIMVYLNDEYDGGNTNFYNETQSHYSEPDSSKVEHSFRPTKGSCLIFNSAITHDGQPLQSGQKWILRSEIMYHHQHIQKGHLAVVVGTESSIKINAVERYFKDSTVSGCANVESGVRPQPVGAEETATGAKNRAMAALSLDPEASVGIGIENGMMWEYDGKPVETPNEPSIFNAPTGGSQLVDKACIAIIRVKTDANYVATFDTRFYWSDSLTIPPVQDRPFSEGPNGEWSELKDPHVILTGGKKNREEFIYQTLVLADPLEWLQSQ
jgi:hypothetical protein